MFTSPALSARQAPEINGQPPHHTIGVASEKPRSPIETPNGGIEGSPNTAPAGEKMIKGRDRRVETTKPTKEIAHHSGAVPLMLAVAHCGVIPVRLCLNASNRCVGSVRRSVRRADLWVSRLGLRFNPDVAVALVSAIAAGRPKVSRE
jgi:hypothetical protein